MGALLDEQAMPESCLDYREDSTSIIKPEGEEYKPAIAGYLGFETITFKKSPC
jgi:hypothetical protein